MYRRLNSSFGRCRTTLGPISTPVLSSHAAYVRESVTSSSFALTQAEVGLRDLRSAYRGISKVANPLQQMRNVRVRKSGRQQRTSLLSRPCRPLGDALIAPFALPRDRSLRPRHLYATFLAKGAGENCPPAGKI
jgi:hypothetical protein